MPVDNIYLGCQTANMVDKLTQFEALQMALAKAGSQAELARIAGVSTTAVWKWVQSSKRVPAEFVLKIEAATGVSRHDLRPDIYPREVMTDRHVGARFGGVDRHAGFDPVHGAHPSARQHGVDFNRGAVLKGAAR